MGLLGTLRIGYDTRATHAMAMTRHPPIAAPDAYAEHGDVRIAYWQRGRGQKTVLLIMGINMRAAHWGDHFISALADHFRVLCFDNRGTGYSTKPVEQITAELWAGDALSVLDAAGVQKAAVIGVSMGGRVAQQLMVDHAERVERAVLLSSAVGGPNAVGPMPRALVGFGPAPAGDPAEALRDSILSIVAPGFGERDPAALQHLMGIGSTKRTPLSVLGKQIDVLGTNVCARLPEVRLPTLIVHGDDDPLVPHGNGEELARLLRHATFATLPGCGHLASWEAPGPLLQAVMPFLSAGPS